MAIKSAMVNSLNEQIEIFRKEKIDNDHKYTTAIQELQRKNAQLQQKNMELNEEQKEMNMELNELRDIKDKYDKLLRKSRLDESQYMIWDGNTITDWMMTLSDEYQRYEAVLRKTLKEEEVDGSLLPDLDKNDLHRFGIKVLKHKIGIIKEIQRLSSSQSQPAAPAAYQPQQFQSDGPGSTAYI